MILEVLFLGLLQGVLEWLPISSQGNLVLLMLYLLSVEAGKALELAVFLHIGTLLSATLYFRRELIEALGSLKGEDSHDRGRRLLVFLLSATAVTGLLGFPLFLLAKITATTLGEGLIALTGTALILNGLSQRRGEGVRGVRGTSNLTLMDGVTVGLAQGLSALPGVSRSGITTTVLLLRGFKGNEALRLSFLLSIPAVLSAEAGMTLLSGLPSFDMGTLFLAGAASFASSLLSIHGLMKLARRMRFWLLCVLLGALSLIPLLGYL